MVDKKNDYPENFVINGKYDDEESPELDRDDYYDNHSGVFLKKSFIPFVAGGVGLIVIVILLVILLSGPKDVVDSRQLQSLEARIQQLEKEPATNGVMDQTLDRLDKQEQKLNLLSKRFSQFNSTTNTQIDQIIKELKALHSNSSQPPQSAKTAPKKTIPKIHQVRPGDTLYGISRHYGLTVEQLRSYNEIGPKAAIHPGQRLKLPPN